jgi:hypothetical protein
VPAGLPESLVLGVVALTEERIGRFCLR